jgi:hypothetical protein
MRGIVVPPLHVPSFGTQGIMAPATQLARPFRHRLEISFPTPR